MPDAELRPKLIEINLDDLTEAGAGLPQRFPDKRQGCLSEVGRLTSDR